MDVKIAQTTTDKFLLPMPVGPWKKPYRPRSSLLSSSSLVKAQMAQTSGPATLALALAKVISTSSFCQFCNKDHNQESARDLDKTSKQKPFKCQFCQEIFSISCLFIEHMKSHTGKSLYRCEFCGILFVDFFSMIAHRKDHLAYPCKQCAQKFPSCQELAKHMTSSHSQKKKKTPRLSKLSKKAFSLKVDTLLQQNTNVLKPVHTCEICYKSFPLLSHLLSHKKCHTKEKPFKCEVCGKNFKHSTVLKIHQQQHTGAGIYVCEHCGRGFSQCRHLASHIRTHSKEKTPLSGSIQAESPKPSALLLTTPNLLPPGQIMDASGSIENIIPAHSKGKLPLEISNSEPRSVGDAPLDFRQPNSDEMVRNSVIHVVGGNSGIMTKEKPQLTLGNSVKISSLITPSLVSQAVSSTSTTKLISSSSIAPIVSSSTTPVLLPAAVCVNPMAVTTSPIPVINPTIPANPKPIPAFALDSIICPNKTKSVVVQRPAEDHVVASKSNVSVDPSSGADPKISKELLGIRNLPLKLKLKEEPEKWLTLTHTPTTGAVSFSTPSQSPTPNPKLLKTEKLGSNPEVPISYVNRNSKNSRSDEICPVTLIKCEPMEISVDKASPNVLDSSSDSEVASATYQLLKTPISGSSDPSSQATKVNDRIMTESPPINHHDSLSENGEKINVKISLQTNESDETPLSLVKKDSVEAVNLKKGQAVEKTIVRCEDEISNNVCIYCGEESHSKEMMNFLENNPGNKPFKCHLCGKTFLVGCLFSKHMESHTGKILYQCEVCHKIFGDFLSLIFHRKTMHQGYVCSQCNQPFVCESDLKRHTRLVHYVEKTYDCEYCGKLFSRKSSLTFHKRVHTGELPYVCEECGRKFARLDGLKAHMRRHLKLQVDGQSDLHEWLKSQAQHVIQMNLNEKPFECHLCDDQFLQSRSLMQHLRSRHSTEKLPYNCDECGKGFKYSCSLTKHKQSHQENDKPKENRTDIVTTDKETE